jgi:hypothetical protein
MRPVTSSGSTSHNQHLDSRRVIELRRVQPVSARVKAVSAIPILDASSFLVAKVFGNVFLPFFATDGGLISYGPDEIDMFRRAAGYVDRILKGDKASGLPVQQPTNFRLVINLKTAKALGVEIPTSLGQKNEQQKDGELSWSGVMDELHSQNARSSRSQAVTKITHSGLCR